MHGAQASRPWPLEPEEEVPGYRGLPVLGTAGRRLGDFFADGTRTKKKYKESSRANDGPGIGVDFHDFDGIGIGVGSDGIGLDIGSARRLQVPVSSKTHKRLATATALCGSPFIPFIPSRTFAYPRVRRDLQVPRCSTTTPSFDSADVVVIVAANVTMRGTVL